MQETRVLVETKGTTGEETISYWFELPIDVAEFEEKLGLLVMPQFIEITGVWLAVPVAEILTLCISLYLNFRLWRSWNNQNNSYEKIQKGYYDRS